MLLLDLKPPWVPKIIQKRTFELSTKAKWHFYGILKIGKSIYKDKNNNKFKNKLVKAFRNMHLQYYIDIHKIS